MGESVPARALAPAASAVHPTDRVAVLWGGGLGDALAIRPLLQRLSARLERPPLFLCASAGYVGLWSRLGVKVEEVAIPRAPGPALHFLRGLGAFDLVYLGPTPTLPTRLLARAMRAKRVWSEPGVAPDQFIPEVVCLDVHRLGLAQPGEQVAPYGGAPLFVSSGTPLAPLPKPYLAVHLTARPHWEAKQWPVERWVEWLARFLAATSWDLVCLGSAEEADAIRGAVQALVPALQPRVHVETSLPLDQVEQRIAQSEGLVGHNSGLMHVALALQKRTVVLTGSPARFWRPRAPSALNLTSGLCGLACNQHRCPVPLFRAKCIRALDVATVHEAVLSHVVAATGRARA